MGQITNGITTLRRRGALPTRRDARSEPAQRLWVLGREGGDAAVGVDRDLELVEEVPTEETVHGCLLDVVRDDEKLADLRAADLEGVERRRLHARGPGRAADLAGRPLRQGHSGRLEDARIDDGPVRARVQDELCRGSAVDRRVDDDRLSLRELDLGAGGARRSGRARRRRRVPDHDGRRRRAVPLGDAVDTLGVVGHALLVHPAIDLGVGGCGENQDQERQDERWHQDHWAHPTVPGNENGTTAVGDERRGRPASRTGYDAFFSSSFLAAVASSFVASLTPFLNSLTLDPSDRARSGNRLAPKRISTITRMISSS